MNLRRLFLPVLVLSTFHAKAQPCNLPFTASYTPALVCSDRPVQFNSSFIPGATYTWAGPIPVAGVQNPLIASMPPGGLGIYTVTAVAGPCTYTASFTIDVKITPKPFTAGYGGPVCPGQTAILNAAAAGHSGVSYEWKGPNGFTLSTTSSSVPLPNMQTINTGVYTAYALSGDGCATDPVDVQVDIYPAVKADFATSIKQLCDVNDEVNFTDQSAGNKTTTWDFGDGTPGSTIQNPTHGYPNQPFPPNTSTVFTVTLISGNGNCYDTIKKNIEVGHPITADFTVDDDSICQHTTINLTNTSGVTPATVPGYEWNLKDGFTSNKIDISHTFDKQGEYDVTLIVTDYLGCKDTAIHHVVVDSAGFIKFTTSDNELCAGARIGFDGDYSPQGLLSDTWDLGDGNTLTSMKKIVHAYDKPGNYHISYTADYRICPDQVFSTDITIKPYPLIDLGSDRTICPYGEPIALKDIINDGNPKAKWKWNSEVMNTTSSMRVYNPGTYSSSVEIDGCSSTDSVIITKNCYIDLPNAFTPNGDGNNDFFLPKDLLARGLNKFNMTIFNRWGGKVYETKNIAGAGWDGKFNGEIQPVGVYVYLIEAGFENGSAEKYQGNITLLR